MKLSHSWVINLGKIEQSRTQQIQDELGFFWIST